MIAGYDQLRERGRMSVEETAKIFPDIVAGARAANVSVTEMADTFGTMMLSFKLKGADAGKAMAMLTKGAFDFRLNITELAKSAPKLADSMKEWGYTGTEAVSKMIGFLYGMEGRFNSTQEAASDI